MKNSLSKPFSIYLLPIRTECLGGSFFLLRCSPSLLQRRSEAGPEKRTEMKSGIDAPGGQERFRNEGGYLRLAPKFDRKLKKRRKTERTHFMQTGRSSASVSFHPLARFTVLHRNCFKSVLGNLEQRRERVEKRKRESKREKKIEYEGQYEPDYSCLMKTKRF